MYRDDTRIPVVVGELLQAGPGDRVLVPPRPTRGVPGHRPGCACCQPRSALALALASLFLQRARDPALDFSRVLVVQADAPGVAAAIEDDVLARARYRFAGRA